jgi:hypothetical protein
VDIRVSCMGRHRWAVQSIGSVSTIPEEDTVCQYV